MIDYSIIEKRGSENLWINWFYSKKYADSLEYIEFDNGR